MAAGSQGDSSGGRHHGHRNDLPPEARRPDSRTIPGDLEITEFEPIRLIAFRVIAGPVRPNGRYVLEAGDGATQVTFSLDAELSGTKKLMRGMVQKSMDGEVGALANLKRVLEEMS
jgi:hypothetical protein